MTSLYADENFPFDVVLALRHFGVDVLTAQEAGQARQKIPDPVVLAYAIGLNRTVLTLDYDFVRLHKRTGQHCGIVYCTRDDDIAALAQRVHAALIAESPLNNKLIRVRKPSIP